MPSVTAGRVVGDVQCGNGHNIAQMQQWVGGCQFLTFTNMLDEWQGCPSALAARLGNFLLFDLARPAANIHINIRMHHPWGQLTAK